MAEETKGEGKEDEKEEGGRNKMDGDPSHWLRGYYSALETELSRLVSIETAGRPIPVAPRKPGLSGALTAQSKRPYFSIHRKIEFRAQSEHGTAPSGGMMFCGSASAKVWDDLTIGWVARQSSRTDALNFHTLVGSTRVLEKRAQWLSTC